MNVGTIIHCTYMNNLREELNRAGDNPYTLDVMKAVYPKVKEVVKRWIRERHDRKKLLTEKGPFRAVRLNSREGSELY